MKYKVFKLVWLISFLFLSITLSGCIDILQLVQVNKNSLTIKYRISMSKQLAELEEKQEEKKRKREQQKRLKEQQRQQNQQAQVGQEQQQTPPPPMVEEKVKTPSDKMGEGFSAFRKNNRAMLIGLKIREINSNTEVGWSADFTVRKRNLNKIKLSDNLPLVPRYYAKVRRLVFEFKENPLEKGKKKKSKKKSSGMDKTTGALFSSAIYTIVISGDSRAKSAYIQKVGGKERQKLEVIKARGFSIIKFPWISMFLDHEQFQVVVQL